VVRMRCNVWQRWFSDGRFASAGDFAVLRDLFFNRFRWESEAGCLGALEDGGVEAIAGVDAGEGSQGAFTEG
jgi:hypothetical protein